MTETLVAVGARLNSSRLPRKHLLPLAGRPLIERIFQRLERLSGDVRVILATTADDYNQPLLEWARGSNRECFAYDGDVNDLVGRVDALVQKVQPAGKVVYVCGDCPLVDPCTLARLLDALDSLVSSECQATIQSDPRGRHTVHEGMVVLTLAGWHALVAASRTPLQREHVGLALKQVDTVPQVAIRVPEHHWGEGYRFSVDTAADYFFQQALHERWYRLNPPSTLVDLDWVLEQLSTDPRLLEINAHVMQKSAFRSYGKLLLVAEASPKKGLGQLRRMVCLAERLQEEAGLGTEILVLGKPVSLEWLRFTRQRWVKSEEALAKELDCYEGRAVVIDLCPQRLETPTPVRRALSGSRERGIRCVGIDQMHHWADLCDRVVVPSFYFPSEPPHNLVYGLRYFILHRQLPVSGGPSPEEQTDLLVLTGGSDAFGYGRFLPRVLDNALPERSCVHWVQGPYAPAPDAPAQTRCRWIVEKTGGDLAVRMRSARLVLSVYGVSLFEALATNRPCVALPAPGLVSDSELQAFAGLDLAPVMFDPKNPQPVINLLQSPARREQWRKRVGNTDLAQGTARVAGEVLSVIGAGNSQG